MVNPSVVRLVVAACLYFLIATAQAVQAPGSLPARTPVATSANYAPGTGERIITKDFDGDGVPEFTGRNSIAQPGADASSQPVEIFSATTGAALFQDIRTASDRLFRPWGIESTHSICAPSDTIIQLFGITFNARNVADAGDVNGDGWADFILSHPNNAAGGLNAGIVIVRSGRNGSQLFRKTGNAGDRLGWSASGAGDVNNDGYSDFIASALTANGGTGSVFVYSGQDGTVLYQVDGTSSSDYFNSVSGAGDVNADGWDDFIIGNSTAVPGPLFGMATVYSGQNGSVLYHLDGSDYVGSGDLLGFSVDGAGDVNADGFADFIVGAPSGFFSATMIGRVFVFSGKEGALLFQKEGTVPTPENPGPDEFGMAVSGAGDVNSDGYDDVIVGAPFYGRDTGNPGSIFVYSGMDGSLLLQKDGEPGISDSGRFGLFVDGAGDVDGDGFDDFIVGNPGAGLNVQGSALVFCGSTGGLLFQKDGSNDGDAVGTSVAGGGDVNADGRCDFIINVPGPTSVFVYGLPCAATTGDFNDDTMLTPSDVVLILNCVFLGSGSCHLCFADVNCDGPLTPADVVTELNAVFLGTPFPCGS